MESNKVFFRGSCVMISFQDRVRSLIFAAVQCCRVDGIVLWKWLWMLWTQYRAQYSGQSVTCELSRNLVILCFAHQVVNYHYKQLSLEICVWHLAMYWNQFFFGVFQLKISFGNHFLLVLLFCKIFPYYISIAFSSNPVLRTIAISGESLWRPQLSHCVRVIWPILPDYVRMP